MLLVVSLRLLLGGVEELEADELEAFLLESFDDVSDEAALDTVGLDCDEGTLVLGAGDALRGDNCRGLTSHRHIHAKFVSQSAIRAVKMIVEVASSGSSKGCGV